MNIRNWLTQTVTVASTSGRSGSGDPTYNPQVTMAARVERNVRLRIGAENTLADVHVMVTEDQIKVGWRVWLPGDDIASTLEARRPLAVKNAATRDNGYTFYETYFAA